ncbi:hypothetical protein E2P81_ATG06947 [Venturia nashicola]|uniref:Uncharacterized protein n=1 Tax=Venturia nashicola TaxID=86259 RepID=A0A4Z1PDC5_9PEZI|nr:hypothetical protein E6O75_ATG07117 [Venturia nashicola]TLD30294.1 hypothetical protein E2P81_ATG06947 [Venturia nashicola]
MSQDSRLMNLPLEMRHKVYGFASQRPHPNLILKEYLEKTDPDIDPPQVAAPVTSADGGEDEDSESGEQGPEVEAMDEDEEASEPENQGENEDVAMTDVEDEQSDEPETTADTTSSAAIPVPSITSATMENISAEAGEDEADDSEEEADGGENDSDENNADENDGDDDINDDENDGDESDGDSEGEQEEDDGSHEQAPSPVRRREYTGRHTKYRHMLATIKTRGCPPPIGLLQVNKQIHDEAMEYHYRTSFVEIDVTAAFAHQSFFEETLDKFMNNAFSPMEQVRKVKITFTWDSEWLREKTTPPGAELEDDFVFGFYLNERITKTCAVLAAIPELRHVEVDWYDTERTDKSQNRMNDTLMEFLSLGSKEWTDNTTEPPIQKNVDITFREHISEAGIAHARNSLLAKHRIEFDQIIESGMAFR